MKLHLLPLLLGCALLTVNCSEAQSGKNKAGKKNGAQEPLANVAGLTHLPKIPKNVPESSGLAKGPDDGTFYTHGDGGNDAVLYVVNQEGKLLNRIKLPLRNFDWESLAEDDDGNLYIGDCGNNENQRKNLAIYKVNPENPGQTETINFSYADQKDFPPKKKARNFDCEATLWHEGKIYLFTRDRGQRKTSKVYEIPAQPGTHQARKIASLNLSGEVTGADLSPDGNTLALIAKEKLFLFTADSFSEILKAQPREISLSGAGQTEGVLFTDDDVLLISSEEGNLYQYEF